MSIPLLIASIGSLLTGTIADTTLKIDFRKNSPGTWAVGENGSSLVAKAIGTVTPETNSVRFHQSLVRIQQVKIPSQAFTIETVFKINQFGEASSWHLSDVLTTATWPDDDNTMPPGDDFVVPDYKQGVTIRVGGGKWYPQMPILDWISDWSRQHAYGWNTVEANSRFSRCILDFVVGPGGSTWHEAYSDRCVQRGRWTHVVASFDGYEQRLFINGVDALDGWRTQGEGSSGYWDTTSIMHVGSRGTYLTNTRYLDGSVQYAKVYRGAAGLYDANRLYQMSGLVGSPKAPGCSRQATLLRPATMQVISPEEEIQIAWSKSGNCGDGSIDSSWSPGDTVIVEAIDTAEIPNVLGQIVASKNILKFKDLNIQGPFNGDIKLRVREKNKVVAARSLASSGEEEWSIERPLILEADAANVRKRAVEQQLQWVSRRSLFVPESQRLSLSDVSGRRYSAPTTASNGGKTLDLSGLNPGIYLLTTSTGSNRILVR